MFRPVWMSEQSWKQMCDLKTEWDQLMVEHRQLRDHVRKPEDSVRLQSINSRIKEIDKKIRVINNENPMLAPNVLPILKLEKVWQRFWELRDHLLESDDLSPKDRFHSLCEALNLGDELIKGGHERREEVKPLMQYLMQQLIYGVHLTEGNEILTLEVSNSFGDQLIEPIRQIKIGIDFLPEFFEQVRATRPTKMVAFNFEGKTTTNWSDVVYWLQEKLFNR